MARDIAPLRRALDEASPGDQRAVYGLLAAVGLRHFDDSFRIDLHRAADEFGPGDNE